MRINSNDDLQSDTAVLISLLLTSEYDYKIMTDADDNKYIEIKFKSGYVFKLRDVYDFLISELIEKKEAQEWRY